MLYILSSRSFLRLARAVMSRSFTRGIFEAAFMICVLVGVWSLDASWVVLTPSVAVGFQSLYIGGGSGNGLGGVLW